MIGFVRTRPARGATDPARIAAMNTTIRCFVTLLARAAAASAPAITITVDGVADGAPAALVGNGTCELREAVAAANGDAAVDACPAGAGADTIDFDPAVSGIQLTAGQLWITSPLTIAGPGAGALVIAQTTPDSRVVEVDDQTGGLQTITFTGLEFRGGSVLGLTGPAGLGGAILNREDLTLDDVTLRGSAAQDGGAIFSTGKLTIRFSRLLDSSAVTGSGALACEANSVCRIEDSVVRGAESTSGPAFGRMRQSTEVDIVRSELSDFSGSGHALRTDNVLLKIQNSTYSDPDTAFLSVENGTVAELAFATVAGAGADVFVGAGTTLSIRASILEGELSKAGDPVLVANFSVFADNPVFFVPPVGSSLGVNPQLLPLRDNGGPSRSHDLAPTSPARDKAPPTENPCDRIFVDQRGLDRPHEVRCDAGAVESGSGTIFADGFEG